MITKEELVTERQNYKTRAGDQLRRVCPSGEKQVITLFQSLTEKEKQEWSLLDIKGVEVDKFTLCYLVHKRRNMVKSKKNLIHEYLELLSGSLDRITDLVQNEVLFQLGDKK